MKTLSRLFVSVLAAAGIVHSRKADNVRVAIISKVDIEVDVFWINTWQKNTLVPQKEEPISAHGQLNVDSFFGHSFLIVDHEHTDGLATYDPHKTDPKIMSKFTMGEFDIEAKLSRDDGGNLKIDVESALTRTSELMATATETCRNDPVVKKAIARRKGVAASAGIDGSCTAGDEDEVAPEFMDCITKAVAVNVAKKESEANKSMRLLEMVGDRARNYTCADPLMDTTNSSVNVSWTDPVSGKIYSAKNFLDEPSAKIYLLDDFASNEECAALKATASPHLQDATVNAGAGKSTLSSARRAKAGGVSADLDNSQSKTAGLYRRGYAFANHITGYNMELPGQEGFSVIKYGPDDEYRPHCDGDCTGIQHRPGGRVATMVIYCEQAEIGGGTTFSSSDVFVNGKKGQAAFFSYLGPDGRTDNGRTRHSGCPILKGTKWIATLWMRLGVTAERGWQYYDPSGLPSAFALKQVKGDLSEDEAEHVRNQDSAADRENSNATIDAGGEAVVDTVHKQRGIDASGADGSTATKVAAETAGSAADSLGTSKSGNEGTEKDEGVFSGIADKFSSFFSS